MNGQSGGGAGAVELSDPSILLVLLQSLTYLPESNQQSGDEQRYQQQQQGRQYIHSLLSHTASHYSMYSIDFS